MLQHPRRLLSFILFSCFFHRVKDFEYTPECIIFDLLNIPLYHGWLVDPQCDKTVRALQSLGYNQIVEKIIRNKCTNETDLVTEGEQKCEISDSHCGEY
jgi:hypothetical protein